MIVAGVGIVRVDGIGPLVVRQRFLESLEAAQRKRAQLQRRHVVRLLFEAQVEMRERFLEPSSVVEQGRRLACRLANGAG